MMTKPKNKVEKDGIFIFPNQTYTLPEEKRTWLGQWIWASDDIYPQYQESPFTLFQKIKWNFAVFYFRKKFQLNSIPKEAVLYISADSFYKVCVNDQFIGRGSAQPGGDYANCDSLPYKYYEYYDVKSALREGENIISVQVCLGPVVQSEVCCGHGGLIADLCIECVETAMTVKTDTSWECMRERAYESREVWNGSSRSGMKDGGVYSLAGIVENQGQFPELLAAAIPRLRYIKRGIKNLQNPFDKRGSERVNYNPEEDTIHIKAGAPYTFWLDYGEIYAAWPHMEIEGGAGTKVTLHMQEFQGKLEREGTTEIYVLGEGWNHIESLRMHSVHYIQVTISNIYKDVKIKKPQIEISVYPSGMDGDFQCSDPVFEKIYRIGCRTNQICRQTYHMDSPIHQEPLGCMGDYMIESLMNYYTFGDQWLTRFDILKISRYLKLKDYKMFHTSYCLLYIQMIYDYVLYTGDVHILDCLEETVTGIIHRFTGYLGEKYLIEHAPNYMFMDWVAEGSYNRHHPPKCMGQGYLTVMLAGALNTYCKLLQLTGNEQNIVKYKKIESQIKEGVNRYLWDEEKQLYVDGLYDEKAVGAGRWLPKDTIQRFYSQHMNTLAVLYDVAPGETQTELMRQVMENHELSQAQPYFMHFVLNALSKTGLFETFGLNQIRRWDELISENESGLKEVWYGFDCDYSHAWGGTPTYQLPAKILGVVPAAPGFKQIYFTPCLPKELEWAAGTIPSPQGLISVTLKREAGKVEHKIELPPGIELI